MRRHYMISVKEKELHRFIYVLNLRIIVIINVIIAVTQTVSLDYETL